MKPIAKIQIFFIISLVCVGFFSCDPNEDLPPQTILKYRGHQLYRDSANNQIVQLNLQIYFQDGDGNIGSETENNLFVHVLDKQHDDTFQPVMVTDTEPSVYSYCVPYYGQPSIKGTFDITMNDVALMQLASLRGIVKFQIYMFDRDLVSSDTIYTPEISIR